MLLQGHVGQTQVTLATEGKGHKADKHTEDKGEAVSGLNLD